MSRALLAAAALALLAPSARADDAVRLLESARDRLAFGDAKGAVADLDKAVAQRPQYAEAYLERGWAESNLGSDDAALADFEKAIALDGTLAEAWAGRAMIRDGKGDDAGAVADAGKAIELKSANFGPYALRGFWRYDHHEFTGALTDLDRALEIDPSSFEVRLRLWMTRARLGEEKAATAQLDEAMKGAELDPWSKTLFGYLTGGATEAVLLQDAAKEPKERKARMSLARRLIGTRRLLSGDKAGARAEFEKCLKDAEPGSFELRSARAELSFLKPVPAKP